jgi:acetyl esterase/lipase
LNGVADLTGELAQAREALAARLKGVDPSDFPALRAAYDAFSANDPLPPECAHSEMDLGGVHAVGVLPKGASGEHVIFWLHGGGFTMGSSRSHRGVAAQVAMHAASCAVVPDYRLSPEHVYPAALDDAVAAYKGVLAENVAPSRIVVVGDSAGGGLAIALVQRLRAAGVGLPAGLALLSPWVDYAHTGWSIAAKAARDPFLTRAGMDVRSKQYLGTRPLTDPEVALLDIDFRGFPRTLIQVGEAEILLSDSTRLTERVGAAGAPVTLEIWPDMFHVFQARYTRLTQARQALERVGLWAKAHFSD